MNPGEARPSSGAATLFATSLLVLSLLMLSACMTVPKGRGDYDTGYMERGIASWYGGYFHGRPTASGTVYDQFRMTAAHRLLPLGSMVRVTNAQNGREVMVVINDRGPFIRGRVIDLSYAVAQQLGVVKQGTIPVRIEVVLMGNRGAMPPFVRLTEMEQEDGVIVGGYVLWVAQSEDPRDGDAWVSEVGNLVRQAARGSRDVLRAPPRSRKSRV